jgi:hypothetical protein
MATVMKHKREKNAPHRFWFLRAFIVPCSPLVPVPGPVANGPTYRSSLDRHESLHLLGRCWLYPLAIRRLATRTDLGQPDELTGIRARAALRARVAVQGYGHGRRRSADDDPSVPWGRARGPLDERFSHGISINGGTWSRSYSWSKLLAADLPSDDRLRRARRQPFHLRSSTSRPRSPARPLIRHRCGSR